VGQFGYDNSQLLRFTEEAIAEGYASRSIIQGLRHPFVTDQFGNRLYGIAAGGLIRESVVGGTIVVGGAYGASQAGEQLFGNGQ